MRNPNRRLAIIGGATLLAAALTGCGGVPTDADEAAFCTLTEELSTAADDVDEGDYDALAEAYNDMGEQMSDVGTPEDIPEDAREGFELLAEAYVDATAESLEEDGADTVGEKFSADDEEAILAFLDYQVETCLDVELPQGE